MAVISKKKKEIYTRAAELFRDKGYRASSMRELAERVGLEPSSLYSHISSKEEILQKICFDVADSFLEGMAVIRNSGYDPLGQLEAIIQLHVEIAMKDRTAVTVFSDEWRNLSPVHLERFTQMRKKYERDIYQIIREGINSKQLKDIDPDIMLNTLLSALRWIYYRAYRLKQKDQVMLEKEMTDLLLHGFRSNT